MAKIQCYQPRIVAFVGLDISKTVRDAVLPVCRPYHPSKCLYLRPVVSKIDRRQTRSSSLQATTFPGKFKFLEVLVCSMLVIILNIPMRSIYSVPVSETLFFAMPSSSGLVVQYQVRASVQKARRTIDLACQQLTAKIKIFQSLCECLEQVKSGSFDTSSFVTVDVANLVKSEVAPDPPASPLQPVELSPVKAEEEPKAEAPICNPNTTKPTDNVQNLELDVVANDWTASGT